MIESTLFATSYSVIALKLINVHRPIFNYILYLAFGCLSAILIQKSNNKLMSFVGEYLVSIINLIMFESIRQTNKKIASLRLH